MKQTATEPAMLTVMEAAALLRIGRTAAYQLARRGEIPTVRLGGALRVPRVELERSIRRGTRVTEGS